jgi:hypothetical protein
MGSIRPAVMDGLVRMDFLGQFIVTLDRAAQQMWPVSRQPVKPSGHLLCVLLSYP